MKGDFTLKILDALSEAAVEAGDTLVAFMESGGSISLRGLHYRKRKVEISRLDAAKKDEERRRLIKRYHNLVAWLKQDGLIAEEKRAGKKFFKITGQGLRKLKILLARRKNALPPEKYQTTKTSNFSIIAFDIPVAENRKRSWLRGVLKEMGFMMLQQSVWIGKVKIPRRFIDDLHKLHIAEFVEVFEITRSGSLRQKS